MKGLLFSLIAQPAFPFGFQAKKRKVGSWVMRKNVTSVCGAQGRWEQVGPMQPQNLQNKVGKRRKWAFG